MDSYLFNSTDALIDSVYPVVFVEQANANSQTPTMAAGTQVSAVVAKKQPGQENDIVLETNTAHVYQLRFHDRLANGSGQPEDAAIVLEKISYPTPTSENVAMLFTWPIEYIRRYGCETKNIFILELGRRCAGFPNKVLRFDTRPTKASALESDFAALVRKVLKYFDPAATLQKPSGTSVFSSKKHKSPSTTANAACEYAELAPIKPSIKSKNSTKDEVESVPETDYARIVVQE